MKVTEEKRPQGSLRPAYVAQGVALLLAASGYAAYHGLWVVVLVMGLLMVILGLGSLSFFKD